VQDLNKKFESDFNKLRESYQKELTGLKDKIGTSNQNVVGSSPAIGQE